MLKGSIRYHLKQSIPAWVILTIIVAVTASLSEVFRGAYNIRTLLAQVAIMSMVALAQTSVLLIGCCDLSVGSVMAFSTAIMSVLSSKGSGQTAAAIVIILLSSILFGAINGFCVTKLRIPVMVATISMDSLIKGLTLLILPGSGDPIYNPFKKFMTMKIGVFTPSFFIAAFFFVLFFVVFHFTQFGRNTYALGNGEQNAAFSGVNVKKQTIFMFVFSSFLASIAGILLVARAGAGNANIADSYSMDSIASAIIGGIYMNGGSGSVAGVFAGAAIMSILKNAMNMLDISPYYQYIVKGAILVLAMAVFQIKRRKTA